MQATSPLHMKKLLLISLFAAPVAFADISLGGTPQPPAAQSAPADATEYVTMAHEVLGCLKELTGILAGVKDTATADAAAPQISEVAARLQALQTKSESMPRPSTEVEVQVRSSINPQEVQQVAGNFLSAVISIGMSNAYGSEALIDALAPIMNAMPGSAE